jgi:hypothetical protein
MRLEPEFWDALHEICQCERQDLSQLVREIEAADRSVGRTVQSAALCRNIFAPRPLRRPKQSAGSAHSDRLPMPGIRHQQLLLYGPHCPRHIKCRLNRYVA